MRLIFTSAVLLAASCAAAIAGDPVHGKQVFQSCAACHTDGTGGGEIGPSLVGVVGRKAGSRDDYRYSGPMSRANFVWDEPKLRAFVHQPQETVRGTRMPFGGIDDMKDVDDVVAYLATLK